MRDMRGERCATCDVRRETWDVGRGTCDVRRERRETWDVRRERHET